MIRQNRVSAKAKQLDTRRTKYEETKTKKPADIEEFARFSRICPSLQGSGIFGNFDSNSSSIFRQISCFLPSLDDIPDDLKTRAVP